MWRFKPFTQKEPAGLEGRNIDIGNLKIQVKNAIAEGGFSCVYLARDLVNQSTQYALKHMICNDGESLDLVMKEISVMKRLKGHPNVVTLVASSVFDMGRTKEALLVMDFCEKSLVNVLDSRGAGYFDEKQVLLIFRDVCNAVFAMHCQSPPIAHRDLKAENVLLGSDGTWKLCDFGSTSTNHKCFDRPEEMGIEEDNIRKHTTPAYRSPEMWDLYRREVISEKVDIWALGCLLYRICYFKSAFDGESKLQILNGNYRIPELPKYSSSVTDLLKDMLQASPDTRPDITQVWFRVNLLLPEDLQNETPDGSTTVPMLGVHNPASIVNDDGNLGSSKRGHLMPSRSPPPPPTSRDQNHNSSPPEKEPMHHMSSAASSKRGANVDSFGAFWATPHAQDAQVSSGGGPIFDEEPPSRTTFQHSQQNQKNGSSLPAEQRVRSSHKQGVHGNSQKKYNDRPNEDFEIRFDQDDSNFVKKKVLPSENPKAKVIPSDNVATFQNDPFNSFIAEFDAIKVNTASNNGGGKGSRAGELEAEVEKLKEQLKQANLEKAEITSKYEKLSAICRSQRQEIQELKQTLAVASNPAQNKDSSQISSSPGSSQTSIPQREKVEGSVFELQQGMLANISSAHSSDHKPWQAFAEDSKTQSPMKITHPKSVRTTGNRQTNRQTSPSAADNNWGFGRDSFSASPSNLQTSRSPVEGDNTSQRYANAEAKKVGSSQPAGWAGF